MKRLRACLALSTLAFAGCSKCGGSSGPVMETPPADLAAKGLILDQPADGPASGKWVTVSGWFDPAAVASVAVVGAPVDAFYGSTGHVGVPSVPVLVRPDGRFYAPRVPLADGTTTIVVVPFGKGGSTYEPVKRTLIVTDAAEVPATIVIDPAQPEPGQSARLRAATAQSTGLSWQWDFDGDGHFDAEAASASHSWDTGRYAVTARTRINDRWVSAFTTLTVGALPAVTASATAVGAVARLFVIPKYAEPPFTLIDGELPAEVKATRYVVTIAGDEVKVFDSKLAPLFSLPGLLAPSMVVGDDKGRLYVADTGHDRVARFLPSGTLDLDFAERGSFTGIADAVMKKPIALAVGPASAQIFLEGGAKVFCASIVRDATDILKLTNWKDEVRCSSSLPAEFGSLQQLGVKRLEHGIVRPSHLFSDAGKLEVFVTQSKLISVGMGFYQWVETVNDVVDAALGPSEHLDDFAVVDRGGRLHGFVEGRKVSSWSLGYPITAVSAAADGTLYVAGTGHLEARAFAPLR